MSDMDIAFLKQTMKDTKNAVVDLKNSIEKNTNEIHLSNIINLVNLGLMSKDDVMNDSVYQLYKNSLNNGNKVNKKSLF